MGSDRKDKALPKRMVIKPCPHLAGTEDKILWMISRVEHGVPLHHESDNKLVSHPHDKNRNIRDQVSNREIIPDPDEFDEDEEDDVDEL